ncbi:hypothetical protein BCF44_12162 [Kutzneria buriramensis]|uniref:Uncharacterized protein n=1 Tax=Kutzneria buriramensis TaxID=1045776 RepID=A0A3E0GWK5_9PSEU|nr:hypothetical protein BCF44_12162 [Kutzneria buriramensis]
MPAAVVVARLEATSFAQPCLDRTAADITTERRFERP